MKARPVQEDEYRKIAEKEEVIPPETVWKEPATYTVRKFYRNAGGQEQINEEKTEDVFEVRGFLVEPARVGVELGRTINMGAGTYETSRVSVSVSVPCYREELKEAYDFAHEFAKNRIVETTEQINAYIRRQH